MLSTEAETYEMYQRKISNSILAIRGYNTSLNMIINYIKRLINKCPEFKGEKLFRLKKEKYKDTTDIEEKFGIQIGLILSGLSTEKGNEPKEDNHNWNLIIKLIESPNSEIGNKFKNLFEKTYREFIDYLTDKESWNKDLLGMQKYEDAIKEVEDRKNDANYTEKLIQFIQSFENNLHSILKRKRRRPESETNE